MFTHVKPDADKSLHGLMVSGPSDEACSVWKLGEKPDGRKESHRRGNRVTAKVSEPIDPFPLTVLALTDHHRLRGSLSSASVLFCPSRTGAGDGRAVKERRYLARR